jgi:uncharacterized protein YbcI
MTSIASAAAAKRTRSALELEISRALIRFEKETMGRGPLETKTRLLDDMLVVRLKGVLTAAERRLSETRADQSEVLIKQLRNKLLETSRPLLETLIRDLVGVPVLSVHSDLCLKSGERVIVFTLQRPLPAEEPDGA